MKAQRPQEAASILAGYDPYITVGATKNCVIFLGRHPITESTPTYCFNRSDGHFADNL
jgi:hypothetical protein